MFKHRSKAFLAVVGFNFLLPVFNLCRLVVYAVITKHIPANVIVLTSVITVVCVLIALGVYAYWKSAYVLMILANVFFFLMYAKTMAVSGMMGRNMLAWMNYGSWILLVSLIMAAVTVVYLLRKNVKVLFFPA